MSLRSVRYMQPVGIRCCWCWCLSGSSPEPKGNFWQFVLMILMLVFDGAGIHNDPEFQKLFRTEITSRELFICLSTGTRFVYPGWLAKPTTDDRALIATITAGSRLYTTCSDEILQMCPVRRKTMKKNNSSNFRRCRKYGKFTRSSFDDRTYI